MLEFLRKLGAPERKASRAARIVALEGGGRARWTPRDYAALAALSYGTRGEPRVRGIRGVGVPGAAQREAVRC